MNARIVGTVERARESSIENNKSMKNALFVIYARDGYMPPLAFCVS